MRCLVSAFVVEVHVFGEMLRTRQLLRFVVTECSTEIARVRGGVNYGVAIEYGS